jgi:AraC-like DNA-binding protein
MKYISLILLTIVIAWINILAIDNPTTIYNINKNQSLKELSDKGYAYIKTEQPDSALIYLTVVSSQYDKSLSKENKRLCAIALNNIGYIYLFIQKKPELAYTYFRQGLDITKAENISTVSAAIYSNIAKIYDDFGNHDEAITLYKEAYSSVITNYQQNSDIVIMILNDMLASAFLNGQTDSIAEIANNFLKIKDPNRRMFQYAQNVCRSIIAFNNGDYPTAIGALDDAQKQINANTDRNRYLTNLYLFKAQIYQHTHSYNKCLDALMEAERLSIDGQMPDITYKVYRSISKIYDFQNRANAAEKYLLKSYQLQDSLYSTERFNNIKNYETSTAVNTLNRDIRDLIIRNKQKKISLIIAAIGIIAVVILLIFVIINNRRLKERNLTLISKNKLSIKASETEAAIRSNLEKVIEEKEFQIQELYDAAKRSAENASANSIDKRAIKSTQAQSEPLENEEYKLVVSIKNVMENNQEIFNSDFCIERLAEILNSKVKIISTTINNKLGKNFNALLSEYRIKEACKKLANPNVTNTLTIEAIGQSVGYQSRTYFNSIFKKETGLTPSQYQSLASK